MPNLSWMEMLVVGIVALIVIGPKDLPGLFRQVGQFVGKAKGMAREFSAAMNAAADEAGVSEINKTIKAAANPQKFGVDKIREASQGATSAVKAGGETEALKSTLSAERAANKEKMDKAMAAAAEKRIAAEKAAEAAPKATKATKAAPKAAKAPAKKAPAAKAAPKTAAKTAAPKKAAKPKAKPKAKDAT